MDVQSMEKPECVVLVKMELPCCKATGSFGDPFVAEFIQRRRRGVARRRWNDEIRVGPGTQLGTRIVRSGQHNALEQYGSDTDPGQRGEHLAKIALSRRLEGDRLP